MEREFGSQHSRLTRLRASSCDSHLGWRQIRTRVRSPQTNGVVERFFGTLKYEHLYRATIGDGNALAVEVNLFRHTYNTLRPHQALDERTPRAAYLAVEHCD
jgi:putative transposase